MIAVEKVEVCSRFKYHEDLSKTKNQFYLVKNCGFLDIGGELEKWRKTAVYLQCW